MKAAIRSILLLQHRQDINEKVYYKKWIGVSLWSLTSRLRGDDKPFTIETPAQAGVQNYLNMEIVYSHIH